MLLLSKWDGQIPCIHRLSCAFIFNSQRNETNGFISFVPNLETNAHPYSVLKIKPISVKIKINVVILPSISCLWSNLSCAVLVFGIKANLTPVTFKSFPAPHPLVVCRCEKANAVLLNQGMVMQEGRVIYNWLLAFLNFTLCKQFQPNSCKRFGFTPFCCSPAHNNIASIYLCAKTPSPCMSRWVPHLYMLNFHSVFFH